ncbi:hypothetical protein DAPPUDRAFT_311151 [Daphnia pulex]|uniref:Uncharacterized protein n=1 Tax=Daphnia pulex TaxID=6669 RepID=E9FUU1_DAPPU|nr:hypothetical protein DAPPUDRAFT_311151 [Daphnia pulex]|eukprot:EFX88862.1 hypothetical protein DAPPUDRAFT_311151 [Daphnia pulex]
MAPKLFRKVFYLIRLHHLNYYHKIPWFWMVLEDSLQICNMDWAILSVGHEHSANQCPQKTSKSLTVESLAKPPLRIKANNIDVQQAQFL